MAIKGRIRAKLRRGLHRIIFKEERITRMDKDTFLFETRFINKSETPWRILERGRDLLMVKPGEEDTIESWHNRTDWSRWAKVVREKNERLTLTENPAWSCPWQGTHYLLELINESGAPEESIPVCWPNEACTGPSNYITVVRFVPRIICLNVMDPLIKFSKIIWHRKEIRVPNEGTKYFTTEWRVVKECVPRSKADLKKVLAERQALAAERLKEETAQALKEQEKLLMAEETPDA
jgi:hypothetical protein